MGSVLKVALEERDGVVGKVCSKCGHWKDLGDYNKRDNGVGGRRADCKDCRKIVVKKYSDANREKILAYQKKWYLENAEHAKEYSKNYRINNLEWKKDYDKNYRELNKENIALYKKQYAEINQVEIKKKRKEYYEENKEFILAKTKDYTKRNKKKVLGRKRKYYIENRERLLEWHRDYYYKNKHWLGEKAKEWRQKNLEKSNGIKRRYKARKKLLLDDFNLQQEQDVLLVFNGGCALSKSTDIHWDHVIPLAVGHGGTTNGNMVPLRSDLNCSKQDKNIFEWFEENRQRFELSQERFDKLIEWLASANAMTVEEYRDYVYWCHDNPRTFEKLTKKTKEDTQVERIK